MSFLTLLAVCFSTTPSIRPASFLPLPSAPPQFSQASRITYHQTQLNFDEGRAARYARANISSPLVDYWRNPSSLWKQFNHEIKNFRLVLASPSRDIGGISYRINLRRRLDGWNFVTNANYFYPTSTPFWNASEEMIVPYQICHHPSHEAPFYIGQLSELPLLRAQAETLPELEAKLHAQFQAWISQDPTDLSPSAISTTGQSPFPKRSSTVPDCILLPPPY